MLLRRRPRESQEKVQVVRSFIIKPVVVSPRYSDLEPIRSIAYDRELYPRATVCVRPAEKLGLKAELMNKGWHKARWGYVGYLYDYIGRPVKGLLKARGWGRYDFYLILPDKNTLIGSHRGCFIDCGGGMYRVHFRKPPHTPVDMINVVQAYLRKPFGIWRWW